MTTVVNIGKPGFHRYWDGHYWWVCDGSRWEIDQRQPDRKSLLVALIVLGISYLLGLVVLFTSGLGPVFTLIGALLLTAATGGGVSAGLIFRRKVREACDSQHSSAGPPPGWYPDPDQPTRWRWWDGRIWTNQIAPIPGKPKTPQSQTSPKTGWARLNRSKTTNP